MIFTAIFVTNIMNIRKNKACKYMEESRKIDEGGRAISVKVKN
jgi:hypothetical protein